MDVISFGLFYLKKGDSRGYQLKSLISLLHDEAVVRYQNLKLLKKNGTVNPLVE